MHPSRFLIGLAALAILVVPLRLDGFAQTAAPAANLVEGAKREGRVVFYTPLNITDSRALLQRFEQKYPFVKTELLRLSAEPLLNRILTEERAGRSAVDVVNNNVINALKKAKLLALYKSPEQAAYPEAFRDPDGFWTSLNSNYYVLGYNSKLIPAKEAPADWSDLLQPKWKAKIGMDQEEFEWFAAMSDAWGRERALKFHRALAQQQIHWRKGHTLISQLIAAGEFPLGIVYAHRAESMKRAGAPIEWVKSLNPVLATLTPVALAAKAPHPNAAKLLVDFLLSREAQQMLIAANRVSGRSDVESIVPEMHPSKLKLQTIDPRIAEELNRHAAEFRDIYFR